MKEQFETCRPLMFSIAYRMLGSVMDAEDVIQDAYLKYQSVDATTIETPAAFFTTMVTRLCLNKLDAARTTREVYVGPWLPEPLLDATHFEPNPVNDVSKADSISLAFLVILECLTPIERAVFLLREVFDLEYDEIAFTLEKTPQACRKLFSRAKKYITEHKPRFDSDPQQHQILLKKFISAVQMGDLEPITQLLAKDATLWTDGGGKTFAALRPIIGAEKVAKFILSSQKFTPNGEQSLNFVNINGRTAIMLMVNKHHIVIVLDIEILNGKIQALHVIGNPDKLRHLDHSKTT